MAMASAGELLPSSAMACTPCTRHHSTFPCCALPPEPAQFACLAACTYLRPAQMLLVDDMLVASGSCRKASFVEPLVKSSAVMDRATRESPTTVFYGILGPRSIWGNSIRWGHGESTETQEITLENTPQGSFLCRDAKNGDLFNFHEDIKKECERGHLNEAIQFLQLMNRRGISISASTFSCVLQTCMNKEHLVVGRKVHCLIVGSGLDSHTYLASYLIRMFASCGSLLEAKQVFSKVSKLNVYSWSAMISAHIKFGDNALAIGLYHQMRRSSVQPDIHVFVSVLNACSSLGAWDEGKLIHAHTVERGCDLNVFIGNTLIDLYAKCGCLKDACLVFDRLTERDVVTWSTMIAAFTQNGHGKEALQIFQQMQQIHVEPERVTFMCILKACSSIASLRQGKLIHAHIVESGLEMNLIVSNVLIDMYANCGSMDDACRVFSRVLNRDVVTWSAMIGGFVRIGCCQKAIQHFWKMQQEGIKPDRITFVCILKACLNFTYLSQGKLIHSHAIKNGFGSDLPICNTLIAMYAKCGAIEDARSLFDKLSDRDVVTWSIMVSGYGQHGHYQEGLRLFHRMKQEGLKPNHVTFISILKVCSSIVALKQGGFIHACIIESGFDSNVVLGSTLIDMYAKCGILEDACRIFDRIPRRDVVIWSAMIECYAQHNDYNSALQYFEGMRGEGLEPDAVTFVSLLSACSHQALVDQGYHHFRSMQDDHAISPSLEHYNCLVDLLGRAGFLSDAEVLLKTMPFQPNVVGWMSLLGHCRAHCSVELGRHCFDQVVTMEPANTSGYVLMANIYAHAGMWDAAETVEELRRCANAWKKPGQACIEVNDRVHYFVVGDKSHPQRDLIYGKLSSLSERMKEEGYMPCLDLVLQSLSDEDKEDALCGHSEKLAIAFGLLSTSQGTTIRISKNLRVCADCHNAAKIISNIEKREIMISDNYCIHYFKDGACSCRDYL